MVLAYKQQTKNQKKETLLTCLADLFHSIAIQKKKVGSIPPKKFIQRLRKENGNTIKILFYFQNSYFQFNFSVIFDNYMQHDAHEFLNYLLNTIADILQGWTFNEVK